MRFESLRLNCNSVYDLSTLLCVVQITSCRTGLKADFYCNLGKGNL